MIAATLLIVACFDDQDPAGAVAISRVAQFTSIPPLYTADLDRAFADIAQDVPGFAGVLFDESGDAVMLLTNLAAEHSARLRIGPLVAGQRAPSGRRVTAADFAARIVKYNYQQLFTWYTSSRDAVWANEGVIYTDIDEAHNRIEVGVANQLATDRIRTIFDKLDLPADAFNIVISEPIELAADSLHHWRRPFAPGMQLQGAGGLCTLGWTHVNAAGDTIMVTVSHCSAYKGGGPDGSYFYQNLNYLSPGAQEIDDPEWFTGSPCPSGKWCRYSDAAIAKFTTGSTDSILFNQVMRTTETFCHLCVLNGD